MLLSGIDQSSNSREFLTKDHHRRYIASVCVCVRVCARAKIDRATETKIQIEIERIMKAKSECNE